MHQLITALLATVLLAGAQAAAPGAASCPPQDTQTMRLPEPDGPFNVGRVSLSLTDPAREETFTADPNDRREVPIEVWYPADERDNDRNRAPYHPHAEHLVAEIAPVLGLTPEQAGAFRHVRTHAAQEADLSRRRAQYPVLLFSHGNFGRSTQSTFQAEELASQGYVVVGLNHPYMGTGISISTGPVFYAGSGFIYPSDDVLAGYYDIMARDAVFVLDELHRLNQADASGRFTGRLDLARVGMFGHSDGGAATARALTLDARFKAGINQDGYPVPPAQSLGISQPFAYLIASKTFPEGKTEAELLELALYWGFDDPQRFVDLVTQRVPRAKALIKGEGYVIRLDGASHYDFTDLVLLDTPPTQAMRGDMAPHYVQRIINETTQQFFDKYLKGKPAPVLDRPRARYPQMDFLLRQ
ncbi:hypothetical protein N8I74_12765 [Chitiniphilus purpureus]|uniref:Alpha/beta hydrolase n=1 Tax=Chitiniphilus purpureus TaxID=2981137 RepID=A0ABY6DIL8_9NEIS|nr:hypothetical protein [Chitiniphilus sp. CD1]UXY14189.1 hypothetical protein N8I74_12765 [Chitiniphilus sp. CD1]